MVRLFCSDKSITVDKSNVWYLEFAINNKAICLNILSKNMTYDNKKLIYQMYTGIYHHIIYKLCMLKPELI